MLLIKCHVCGVEGEEDDFHYGGEAHIRRPATNHPESVSDAEQRDYLFIRCNPKGLQFERWRCDRGCGKWFHAVRDTVAMDIRATYALTELPPVDLMRQATGEWAAFFADRMEPQAPQHSPDADDK